MANIDASFSSNSPARLRDSGLGVGDLTFGPYVQMQPVMRNGSAVFSQRFELDALAPIGKLNSNRDLNPGSGFWSLNPYWAFTYLPTDQWEFTARLNYIYNFRGHRAPNAPEFDGFHFRHGQAGDAVWVNFATSYQVAPTVRLGINGYLLKQLRDDRTNGQRVVDSKQTHFYAGPGARWQIDARNILNANLYLPVEVKNAASGNNLNFLFIHVF